MIGSSAPCPLSASRVRLRVWATPTKAGAELRETVAAREAASVCGAKVVVTVAAFD